MGAIPCRALGEDPGVEPHVALRLPAARRERRDRSSPGEHGGGIALSGGAPGRSRVEAVRGTSSAPPATVTPARVRRPLACGAIRPRLAARRSPLPALPWYGGSLERAEGVCSGGQRALRWEVPRRDRRARTPRSPKDLSHIPCSAPRYAAWSRSRDTRPPGYDRSRGAPASACNPTEKEAERVPKAPESYWQSRQTTVVHCPPRDECAHPSVLSPPDSGDQFV